mgnify:CR=1 FL=1
MNKSKINGFIKTHQNISREQLAVKCGISENAVEKREARMGIVRRTTVEQHLAIHRDKALRRNDGEKIKKMSEYILTLQKKVDDVLAINKNVSTYRIATTKGADSEATAIWLASDWHVGEKVTRGQTNDINEYNPNISKMRGEQFFIHAVKLTKMMGRDVEIKTVVLALLGDFITGHLHSQAVETNYFAPVEETLYAQKIIASGIEYVLRNSNYNLVIPCASGNHGRTTKFSEVGSETGPSHEFFMYCTLRDHFKEERRVTFIISEGAHTYLDIYGRQIRFLHGHDIKYGGGVGGITIPVNKAIAQWDRARPAFLTCFGHFHQKFDGGNFIANGSLIGYNAFALSIKASAEPPAQQLCLIDSKRGKTIVAPILFTI